MPHSKALLFYLFMVVLAATTANAYSSYRARIPNGGKVVRNGVSWGGVGHITPFNGLRNVFGDDFVAAGRKWSTSLCQADSDGDGFTNGQELGDPDCVWVVTATPARTTEISHPGFADSVPVTIPPSPPATPGVTLPPSGTAPLVTPFAGVFSLDWQLDSGDTLLRGKFTIAAASSASYAAFGVSGGGMVGNLVLCYFDTVAATGKCDDYIGRNWAIARDTLQYTTVTGSTQTATEVTIDFEIATPQTWGLGARGSGAKRVIFAHGPVTNGIAGTHPSGAHASADIDFYTNTSQNIGAGEDDDGDDASLAPVTPLPTPSRVAKNAEALFVAEVWSSLYTETSFEQLLAAELSGTAGVGAVSPSDITVTQFSLNVDTGVATVLFTVKAKDDVEASAISARVSAIPSAKLSAVGVSAVRSYEEANTAETRKGKPNIALLIAISLCAMVLHPFVFGFVATTRLCKPVADECVGHDAPEAKARGEEECDGNTFEMQVFDGSEMKQVLTEDGDEKGLLQEGKR